MDLTEQDIRDFMDELSKKSQDYEFPVYDPRCNSYWVRGGGYIALIPADTFDKAMKEAADKYARED